MTFTAASGEEIAQQSSSLPRWKKSTLIDHYSQEEMSKKELSSEDTGAEQLSNSSALPALNETEMSRSASGSETGSVFEQEVSSGQEPPEFAPKERSASAPPKKSTSTDFSFHSQQPLHQSERPSKYSNATSTPSSARKVPTASAIPASQRHKIDQKVHAKLLSNRKEKRYQSRQVTIEDQEFELRKYNDTNCRTSLDSLVSSLYVIFLFLLTKETYLTMALSVATTCYFYFENKDDSLWDGSGIPFILLGVAVVIPTIHLVTMLFTRREKSLFHLAELRASWVRIFQQHVVADWDQGAGRESQQPDDPFYLGLDHSDEVADEIMGCFDELMRFLTLPTSTMTHHLLTKRGQRRAEHIQAIEEPLFESCSARRTTKLTFLAERLKAAGVKETEISRIEQYLRFANAHMEHLRYLKTYRTPQALRSLARVTTIGMLPLFAPSFADVAINVGSLTLGILLAAFSALVLSGLFEAAKVVEDPFVAFVLMDGVNFHEEADLLLRQIVAIREEAFGQEALDEPYTPPVSACLTTESGLYKDQLDKERAARRAVELRQQKESDSKKAQQQSAVFIDPVSRAEPVPAFAILWAKVLHWN